jgi:hypothetical protein
MRTIEFIQYVVDKACLTQKQMRGALVDFVSDLKKVLDQYFEERAEGLEKRNQRRWEESIARYQAMQEEAEQELKKLRQPKN